LSGKGEDEFGAYVHMSNDFGETWQSIVGNLPWESVNVIAEDPRDKDVLYTVLTWEFMLPLIGDRLGTRFATDCPQSTCSILLYIQEIMIWSSAHMEEVFLFWTRKIFKVSIKIGVNFEND
jgi:hypothetical protein